MDWSAFWGAFIGAGTIVFLIVGVIIVLVWFDERQRQAVPTPEPTGAVPETNRIPRQMLLERDAEAYIVEHFSSLFPDWRIYNPPDTPPERRPLGVRFRTDAAEIDILCLNEQNDYVVIELKRDRAPDRIVAQIDRAIAWVQIHLAEPGHRVRGVIIAQSLDRRLPYILARRPDITAFLFQWHMHFDEIGKHVLPEANQSELVD